MTEIKKEMRRRDALKVLGCGTCAITAIASGCTFSELYSDFEGEAVDVDLSDAAYQALQTIGEMVAIDVGPVKLNLIRTDEATLVAIERICPHLGEDMAPIGSAPNARGLYMDGQLWCTAHGSKFDVQGMPLGGPSNTPIQAFPVEFNPEESGGTATVYVGVAPPEGNTDEGA